MARISAQKLAELAPCPLEQIDRLERLGFLDPDSDRTFPSSDVHVVRLMAAFEDAGISLEDVARGVAAGELSFPLGLFLPEPVTRSLTYESLAADLGRSPDFVRRLSGELGLPPSADDRVRAEDAEMLSLVMTRLDLAEEDELSRFARLYGSTVQRLVGSGLQFFDQTVRQRVATYDLSNEEKDGLVYQKAAAYTQLVAALVPWLQRRHREHSVLEYIVSVTEGFMEERGITPRQPKQPPAIAFLDLTGYSALAEERGDEAAAELAAGLASVVQDASRTQGCRPVKWLGDGVMFHFSDSGRAIRSALDLVEQTEKAIAVPARIGINAGTVIAQEGDYFGRTVNIAARIADYARPREVLVSEDAMKSASVADVEFELIGDVPLKGVSDAVRLHKAIRA
ncbi:MAG TPA: adenylate/guanylate cyclase domain-containing protein [Gaiellaceae bacterium]|nr:adenylate/guanylate cyclase domain-containing protein [Gaiellaceae bacterium]